MRAERGRLTLALLLSLLFHTLLLSLTFGEGHGLPGFAFPWRERRAEAPDLRVLLMPARVTPAAPADTLVTEPLKQAAIEPTVAGVTTSVSTAVIPSRPSEPIVLKTEAKAESDIATSAIPAKAPLPTEASTAAAPAPIPAPEVLAVARSEAATFAVPPPAPVIALAASTPVAPVTGPVIAAPQIASEVVQNRAEPEREKPVEVAKPDPTEREAERERQRKAEQLEAARVEVARLDAARQEAIRVEAARLEAARLAATQLEAQRQEAAQQEAQRKEATRLETVQSEAARLAAAKLEAQRKEVARQEAARAEVARQEAGRVEAVRLAAAEKEAARLREEKEEDAKRQARREAMGRQLNEEADRRKAAEAAARSSSSLPYSLSTARRFRLWGRTDANVELVQYAEAWARKIQLNTPVDTVQDLAKRPHTHPMVTVAIRSDGTVESVTFVLSSGVAEVDEAIRRIVQSNVYPAFPPGLAREYDVIEVRRTWQFDTAVRLY